MSLSVNRRLTLMMQFVLDELLPPIVRDSRALMYLPMRLVLGRHVHTYLDFKDRVFGYSESEFSDVYRRVGTVAALQGETDLNDRCVDTILADVGAGPVLEVGCGRGYLAGELCAAGNVVTATDIVLPTTLQRATRLRPSCTATSVRFHSATDRSTRSFARTPWNTCRIFLRRCPSFGALHSAS